MGRVGISACVLALSAGSAMAGGIDRSGQSVGVIFKDGNYAEFTIGTVSPSVSGHAVALPVPGLNGAGSGDMAGQYTQVGGALKYRFNDAVDAAIVIDQPFGSDVTYPNRTGYFGQGSIAKLDSAAVTGVVKYRLPSNFSLYGGLRYQTLKAHASVPFVANYYGDADRDGGVGWLVGAAYERPEIALRVALTYNSKIKHTLDAYETSALGTLRSDLDVKTPQSINLDFQSGVAKDTLIFGSVRWVEWSQFDITPDAYQLLTGGASLVSYDDDTVSWTLGVGHRFNENWSGAVSFGYEDGTGGYASNLGPTDGYKSIGLAATYTQGNIEVTGAVRYIDIGAAQTRLGAIAPASDFDGNDAWGAGLRVGYSF